MWFVKVVRRQNRFFILFCEKIVNNIIKPRRVEQLQRNAMRQTPRQAYTSVADGTVCHEKRIQARRPRKTGAVHRTLGKRHETR